MRCFATWPIKSEKLLRISQNSYMFCLDEPVDNGGSAIEEYVLEYSLEKGKQMKRKRRVPVCGVRCGGVAVWRCGGVQIAFWA